MSDFPDYVHALYTSVKNTWQDAENLDDAHGYISYVWIPEETFKIDVLKLHVWAEKFRAHSKAALAGGATVVTSAAGGGQTKTSTATTPSHTHDVVIGAVTSGASGKHRHMMFEWINDTPQTTDLDKYGCRTSVAASITLNIDQGANVNLYTEEEISDHTHSVNYGTKTSASGGASHTHDVTIDDHTHQVTLPDHTHGIDFGIYEEDIAGRTLSAVLYDPSGSLVKDFGVVCTGEDSVILDLSEYFETLQYGTWRLELSASGRLRARLLYYELCKMYAQF